MILNRYCHDCISPSNSDGRADVLWDSLRVERDPEDDSIHLPRVGLPSTRVYLWLVSRVNRVTLCPIVDESVDVTVCICPGSDFVLRDHRVFFEDRLVLWAPGLDSLLKLTLDVSRDPPHPIA